VARVLAFRQARLQAREEVGVVRGNSWDTGKPGKGRGARAFVQGPVTEGPPRPSIFCPRLTW